MRRFTIKASFDARKSRMKRHITASVGYSDYVSYRDDPDEEIELGTAMMNAVENLDIFEDDDASEEELIDAVVGYVDKFYDVTDEQLEWVRNNLLQ